MFSAIKDAMEFEMPAQTRSQSRTLPRIISLLALSALPAGMAVADLSPLRAAELSARVHAAGQSANDPLLLITAAKLRREAELPSAMPLSAEVMLDQAEIMAQGDEGVLALISDLRAERSKGVASGPLYQLAALEVGQEESRPPMPFRGGEYAEIYIEAPPGADLDLTVLDSEGRVVCADREKSHIAYCGWTPAEDGEFTLLIENAGTIPADYALMTN